MLFQILIHIDFQERKHREGYIAADRPSLFGSQAFDTVKIALDLVMLCVKRRQVDRKVRFKFISQCRIQNNLVLMQRELVRVRNAVNRENYRNQDER